MLKKVHIKKGFLIAFWCAVAVGGVVLLGAAISHRNSKTCQGYRIEITGGTRHFLDKDEVASVLMHAGAANWQGRHIMSFDLKRMEATLEKNPWVQDAELFFDNEGTLRVNVIERQPIARLFKKNGNNYYIDSAGVPLSVEGKPAAELPVFTDFPDIHGRGHGADSVLFVQVKQLGAWLALNPFWMAQIAQVDITPAKTFVMIPTVGDHLIRFGDGNGIEEKFHRLFLFYKEVLSQTGFDKYALVDVQYAGQVIGEKKGGTAMRTDSLQGMRNIREMIHASQQLQPDTLRQQNVRPLEHNTVTEQNLTGYDLIPVGNDSTSNHH